MVVTELVYEGKLSSSFLSILMSSAFITKGIHSKDTAILIGMTAL